MTKNMVLYSTMATNCNGEDIPVICKDRMKAYLTDLSNSTSSVKIPY